MQDLNTSLPAPSPRSRSRAPLLLGLLLAFLLGAALVAWAAAQGYFAKALPTPQATATSAPTAPDDSMAKLGVTGAPAARIGSLEGRLAMIEDRISRIDFQTHAAAGNATRAESLLIAYSARRLLDRGEPLGFVADQLRLRFGDAQPRAVQTVIEFAARPVTIDELSARLEALSPELGDTTSNDGFWTRAQREVSALFTVRRDASALVTPSARIARARLMLTAGRIENAIGEVQRLPGADAADTWVADARRYGDVQRSLDLLETTAMLEPTRLHDGRGAAVEEASPLAAPAPAPSGAPAAGAGSEPARGT